MSLDKGIPGPEAVDRSGHTTVGSVTIRREIDKSSPKLKDPLEKRKPKRRGHGGTGPLARDGGVRTDTPGRELVLDGIQGASPLAGQARQDHSVTDP